MRLKIHAIDYRMNDQIKHEDTTIPFRRIASNAIVLSNNICIIELAFGTLV